MSEIVLGLSGMSSEKRTRITKAFVERDEQLLKEQHAVYHSEEKLIQTSRETWQELETLLIEDTRQ